MAISLASLKQHHGADAAAHPDPRRRRRRQDHLRRRRRPTRCSSLTEDGLGTLDVPHFPLARTFDEVMEALAALYTEPHDVQDRGGRQRRLARAADLDAGLQGQQGWSSIEEPGYGKGYVAALDLWRAVPRRPERAPRRAAA